MIGAGKTTACLAIAGRIPYSKKVYLEGNRYSNGRPLSGDSELPAAVSIILLFCQRYYES